MKITITVTEDHVKTQERASCRDCAFAQAINEVLREPYTADVFNSLRILDNMDNPVHWLKFSREVRTAIVQLDERMAISLPFSFTAIIPGKYLKPKPSTNT